ncbi:putative ABC transport system permease protein [Marmoricola sp. URHA0025 HA25]
MSPALVALAASVAGGTVATLLTPAALWLLRNRGVTSLHLHAPAPWVAWSIAVPCGAGVALVGSWRASRRAAKISPVPALQEAGLERRPLSFWQVVIGGLCLAGVVTVVVLSTRMEPLFALVVSILLPEVVVIGCVCFGGVLFPFLAGALAAPFAPGNISARLARDHVRTAVRTPAALAAPIVAISSIAGALIIALSFTADWTSALDRGQLRAPLVVEAGNRAAVAAVAADPDVAVADARTTIPLRLGPDRDTEDVEALDLPAAAAARGVRAVRGDLGALHGPTAAVSETYASDASVGVGDRISTFVAGTTVRLRIVAVVADAPDLYGEVLVPRELVAARAQRAAADLVFVLPRDGVTVATLRASLERSLAGTGSHVLAAETWIDRTDDQTRAANNLGLWVLLGPAGLYAGIAIVNAILIGSSQRRRQLRVVAQLGGTPQQLRAMAVWEAGLVGAAALATGTLVTAFVGWMVRRAITSDVAGATLTIPWIPLAAVAATCAGLVLVAALVGARGATRA